MKRFLLLILLLAAAPPARAQHAFIEALPGLAGGFAPQAETVERLGVLAETVERLGVLADPRALPVLRALADGRLLKRAAR